MAEGAPGGFWDWGLKHTIYLSQRNLSCFSDQGSYVCIQVWRKALSSSQRTWFLLQLLSPPIPKCPPHLSTGIALAPAWVGSGATS
jgi:hypothetical protein